MHLVGVRRTLAERYPFLPAAVAKAFAAAKTLAMAKLADTSATKVTLPFVEEQLRAARELMGEDFWSYGLPANRHVLESFLDAHHAQGLSARRLQPDELFHPSTRETHSI
jgi:4,5-dihydroxyphthalate decarboxylase